MSSKVSSVSCAYLIIWLKNVQECYNQSRHVTLSLWLKQEKVDTLLKDLDTKKQLAKAREQEENRLAKIRQEEEDAQRAQALLQTRQAEEAAKIEQERRRKLLAAKQDLEDLEKQE